MPTKVSNPAASAQRRIKNTASKQIRNRSRRRRQDKSTTTDAADNTDGEDSQGDDDDAAAAEQQQQQQQRHQQRLLDIFRDSFRTSLEDSDTFTTVLQEIKQALYERDFGRAFGEPRNLEVYAARWSPTRALCYARIFEEIRDELEVMMAGAGGDDLSSGDDGEDFSGRGEDDADDEKEEADVSEASAKQEDDLAEQAANLDITNSEQQEQDDEDINPPHRTHGSRLPVLAIGGGAAELVAFASHMSSQNSPHQAGHITLLDVGPWGDVVQTLHTHATTTPVLSKYANAAAKAANAPLVAPRERLSSRFVRHDILETGSSAAEMEALLCEVVVVGSSQPSEEQSEEQSEEEQHPEISPQQQPQPLLITLLFTLNELYTTSGIGKTTRFLRSLTAAAPPGTLLLVVDSPGSYSEASVGKEGAKKKYPMQWLLDHTLLHSSKESDAAKQRRAEKARAAAGDGAEEEPKQKQDEQEQTQQVEQQGVTWEKVGEHSHESMWFRMPEGLRYPIALENMRYQMHLYRAV